jgi:hypothetical protein
LGYDKAICVGVYDIDSMKYLKQWGPLFASLDSIICSPLIFEDLAKKIDTIKTWEKFQKKLFSMPILSITTDQTKNGNIDIYVAGVSFKEKESGLGGMMSTGPMGIPIGMPTTGIVSPYSLSVGIVSPYSLSVEDEPIIKKHYYFRSSLHADTYTKAEMGSEAVAYHVAKKRYAEELESHDSKHITMLNRGSEFYLGYYIPDIKQYLIFRYK